MNKPAILFVMLSLAAACVAAVRADSPEEHVARLKQHGVEPTAQSIGDYLRSLHPDEATCRRIAGLLAQLGDDDYAKREAASKQLAAFAVIPPELLTKAIEQEDPEIRWRAMQLKKKLTERWWRVAAPESLSKSIPRAGSPGGEWLPGSRWMQGDWKTVAR